jgi:AbrB family looped-hinge helix DNA binding protein
MSLTSRAVAYSKISVKSQTVLPAEVRQRLGVSAGDRLRYVIENGTVRIEKAGPDLQEDPFAAFTEWASPEDDEAFADL